MFNQLISENALWHLRYIDIGIGSFPRFFHGLERQRREREKMSEKRKKREREKKREMRTRKKGGNICRTTKTTLELPLLIFYRYLVFLACISLLLLYDHYTIWQAMDHPKRGSSMYNIFA